MLFVLAMFLKCATCTCSVVCEIWGCFHVPWCRRREAADKREGVGGGGGGPV